MTKHDAAPATTLLLLRHGEVLEEDRRGLYGQLDVRLSPVGHEQSERTGAALAAHPITAVYSSDLARARILGEHIAQRRGVELRIDARLRERHFGEWQGLLLDEIAVRYADLYAAWQADRIHTRAPGAENFPDLRARILPAIQEIAERHAGETIAIAVHSGTTRMVLAEAMGVPLERIFSFAQDYCCLNVVEWRAAGGTVRLVNSTAHLSQT